VCCHDWKEHRLLFGSRTSNRKTLRHLGREHTAKAFLRYSEFIEENKRSVSNVNAMFRILILLPNLRTITISDMKDCSEYPFTIRRFRRLFLRIWMAPYPMDEVTSAVQTFLLAYGTLNINARTLNINGSFNPALLSLSSSTWCFGKIQILNVNCLVADGTRLNQEATKKFLKSFPDLVDLSVRFKSNDMLYEVDNLSEWPVQDNFIENCFWPQLKTFYLDWLCTSEEKLFGIIERHRKTLQRCVFGHISLTSGSWNSLLTRTEKLGKIDLRIEQHGIFWDQYSVRLG
jgi:hypothetical protein